MGDEPAEVEANSRWQDLYLHLQKSGFDVYAPGMKLGTECSEPYLENPTLLYSKLDEFVQRVKRAMKFAEPMFYPTGAQTPSYYDDSIKAHMVSLTYKNYKKL